MNKLTIQINNLEALERLIGGDTEIELEIRNNIVQAFTKKYLKALVNEDLIKDALTKDLKEFLIQERESIKKLTSSYKRELELEIYEKLLACKEDLDVMKSITTTIDKILEQQINIKLEPYVKAKIKQIKSLLEFTDNENTNNS